MIKYNIWEHFNLIRWCTFIVTIVYVAVVSVAKYIQIADTTSVTFSALENLYLILNDQTNITYIYLPLYLFLICGMMFDDNFGGIEILRCKTRTNWLGKKMITLTFYTAIYFILLIWINFSATLSGFKYSINWSSDFVNVQVMTGQSVSNFKYSPLLTISLEIVSLFIVYLFLGILSIFIALLTNKEASTLFITLLIGIAINLILSKRALEFIFLQNIVFLSILILLIKVCIALVQKKDFILNKKT
ncbi:hypothetical protein AN639_08265 [Candidatus Epulonipiscium fishelsonii]|uniref:Uncharacterized protein n=1 Tax=Candidatus Epulonipiscium fishelsonii TaxID=77094 RepID=A0ACC8XHG5_9FIRM|nr:hypothetical protein AN639_08265 [Epulopiscium sp. SCG-B05WGA-EpuloA1]ONI43026.1 hypothetical protein AN396_00250 [Epulopiscium sp. SCG-B11WGA-EpuloA1]